MRGLGWGGPATGDPMRDDDNQQTRDRIRWPIVIAGSVLFAAVLTVGPILATRDIDAGGSANRFAAGNFGMMMAREVSALRVSAAPEVEPVAAPEPETSAPDTVPPTTLPEPAEPAPPVDGGSVAIDLEPLEPEPFGDGEAVAWEITVTNDGDEYLWGVYAYLEGTGPVTCEARQLDVGATTTCRSELLLWADAETATAWVTAWTINRMVDGETAYPLAIES